MLVWVSAGFSTKMWNSNCRKKMNIQTIIHGTKIRPHFFLMEMFLHFIPSPHSLLPIQNAFLPLTSLSLSSSRDRYRGFIYFLQMTRFGIIPKYSQKLVIFNTTPSMLCTEDTPFITAIFQWWGKIWLHGLRMYRTQRSRAVGKVRESMFCIVMESYKCHVVIRESAASYSSTVMVRSICTFLHDVMEIINGEPCQNAVFWRAAKCHCQVAEFLLHIF